MPGAGSDRAEKNYSSPPLETECVVYIKVGRNGEEKEETTRGIVPSSFAELGSSSVFMLPLD